MFYRGLTLEDLINKEKAGIRYACSKEDRNILDSMFSEINLRLGTDLHYLAELDYYYYYDIGDILLRYVDCFSSEEVKAYLIPQLVWNKVKNCSQIILRLYMNFKKTKDYVSNDPDVTIPICYRYDDAFKHLRSRKIKEQLLELAHNPRDVYYLFNSVKMLASWRIPEMETLLKEYIDSEHYTPEDFLIFDTDDKCVMNEFRVMKLYLNDVGLYGLRYYPTRDNYNLVASFLSSESELKRDLATKTLSKMNYFANKNNERM